MPYELDDRQIRQYFSENAADWVGAGYDPADPRVYPTPLHRARVVCSIFESAGGAKRIADLGCGGGNLPIALAERGHTVTGFDRSAEMLALARRGAEAKGPDVAARLDFRQADISADLDVGEAPYDGIVSMGVIGYLTDDDILFKIARRALKPDGLLLISCRNRLFNMVSLSGRTRREIEQSGALVLLDEIERLYQAVPPATTLAFLEALERAASGARGLVDPAIDPADEKIDPLVDGNMSFEPSQQTPEGMTRTARENGFEPVQYIGIHPHPMDPRLNRLMPAGVYNRISQAAEPFEATPLGLIWSSVFIGVYRRGGGQ